MLDEYCVGPPSEDPEEYITVIGLGSVFGGVVTTFKVPEEIGMGPVLPETLAELTGWKVGNPAELLDVLPTKVRPPTVLPGCPVLLEEPPWVINLFPV